MARVFLTKSLDNRGWVGTPDLPGPTVLTLPPYLEGLGIVVHDHRGLLLAFDSIHGVPATSTALSDFVPFKLI